MLWHYYKKPTKTPQDFLNRGVLLIDLDKKRNQDA